MKKFLYFFSILYILGNCFVEKRSRQHAKTSGSLRGPVRDGVVWGLVANALDIVF